MKKKLIALLLSFSIMGSSFVSYANEVETTEATEEPKLEISQSEETEQAEELEISEILEDAPAETEKLELAPIDPEFTNKESGIKASPLEIKDAEVRTRVRSVYPSRFDLRKEGRVTPVRSQGKNGSCWAFATYGAMESYLKFFGEFDFSEKHMRNTHGFDWGIDDGGNREIAAAYLSRGSGPVSEGADPYDPRSSDSPENVDRMLDIDQIIYLPNMANAFQNDDIKWAIMKYGGVYTTINSSEYYENKKYNSYYNPGAGKADHAVTIVGWDDGFSRNAFTSKPAGDGAWICKNSWGKNFLDNGYYYVSYYDAHCGKSNAVFVPKGLDKEANIYQYDPLGATRSVGYGGEGYMANVFTSTRDEYLKEVGLFNVSARTKYTIYAVQNISKTSELGENKVEIASGVLKYPGYYNIKTDKINIKEGETFGIVVYMDSTSNGYRFPLPVEAKINSFSSKAFAEEGQSYVSANGESWTDLTRQLPDANFCIKAITSTAANPYPDIKPAPGPTPEPDPDPIPDPEVPDDGTVKIEHIELAEGNLGYIDVTKKGQLTALIGPSSATEEVEFVSSKPEICVVDKEKGIVYPRDPGNVNIIARSKSRMVSAVFNLQVVPAGLKVTGRTEVPIIGANDYVPPEPDSKDPSTPKEPDTNGPSIRPGEDVIAPDDGKPRGIYFNLRSKRIFVDEKFNLNENISIYPSNADRNLKFYSSDKNIASIDENGVLTAHKLGDVVITAKSDNGLSSTLEIKVVTNPELGDIVIESLTNTGRSGGIFSINMRVKNGNSPYNGPANIKVTSDDRTQIRTVYFHEGFATVKFNGCHFGVWRKDFEATLTVKDKSQTIKFGFN
ncbi:lectin like domain-containing protein [Lagierella sp.]|uniref:lectin like domain-containing protein n=1 Tax=Lagierella sp. TaxID=2849657 RepID=UPI002630A00F|nr:lectin like domain-containing protein [Lagierella sp.]